MKLETQQKIISTIINDHKDSILYEVIDDQLMIKINKILKEYVNFNCKVTEITKNNGINTIVIKCNETDYLNIFITF